MVEMRGRVMTEKKRMLFKISLQILTDFSGDKRNSWVDDHGISNILGI